MTFSRSPTTYVSAELCLVNSYVTWHGDVCTCFVLVHVLVVAMYLSPPFKFSGSRFCSDIIMDELRTRISRVIQRLIHR